MSRARSAGHARSPAAPAGAGRLGERLVEVASRLLDSEGIEALTLRRIAREAGVTHGAPLRHYRSLGALLAEVAARGFRMLSEAVDKAAAQVPPGADAPARLAAGGHAYVHCAVAHPGLFALMFRPDALDVAHPVFARESREAFERLVRLVRAAQDAGWRTHEPTRPLAGSLWAGVHGLASLWSQGAFTVAMPEGSLDQAIDVTLGLLLADRPRRRIR